MSSKDKLILKTIRLVGELGQGDCTAGEISRWTNIPKTTVRRRLEKLTHMGLVLGDWHNRNYGYALYFSASYELLTNADWILQ